MAFNFEASLAKSNDTQSNKNNDKAANTNNSTKLNNELTKENNNSQTRTKPKASLKEKKCDEMAGKSVQNDKRKAKKKHKHIKRGKKKSKIIITPSCTLISDVMFTKLMINQIDLVG